MEIVSYIEDSFQEYEGQHSLVLFSKGCLYNCYHCHNKDDINKASIGEARDIINDNITPMHTAVVLLGGEPTIHEDIADICRYIKSKDLKVKLYTNGHMVKVIKYLLDSYLLDAISIDFKCIRNSPKILGINIPGELYRDLVTTTIKNAISSNIDVELRTTLFDISILQSEST